MPTGPALALSAEVGEDGVDDADEETRQFNREIKAIEELEEYGEYLKCWRPRRSGKSLFCSHLALYYDIKTSEKMEPSV